MRYACSDGGVKLMRAPSCINTMGLKEEVVMDDVWSSCRWVINLSRSNPSLCVPFELNPTEWATSPGGDNAAIINTITQITLLCAAGSLSGAAADAGFFLQRTSWLWRCDSSALNGRPLASVHCSSAPLMWLSSASFVRAISWEID